MAWARAWAPRARLENPPRLGSDAGLGLDGPDPPPPSRGPEVACWALKGATWTLVEPPEDGGVRRRGQASLAPRRRAATTRGTRLRVTTRRARLSCSHGPLPPLPACLPSTAERRTCTSVGQMITAGWGTGPAHPSPHGIYGPLVQTRAVGVAAAINQPESSQVGERP